MDIMEPIFQVEKSHMTYNEKQSKQPYIRKI